MKKILSLLSFYLIAVTAIAQTFKSPSGNFEMKFSITEKGEPTYELNYKGKKVIKALS